MTVHEDARAAAEGVYDAALRAKDETIATAAGQLEHRTTELHAAVEANTALQVEFDRLTGLLEDADGNVVDITADRDRISGLLSVSQGELAAARARIAVLEAGSPDPEPDPEPEPVRVTRFGSCPVYPGGESLAVARTVAAKWGDEACVRQFKGDFSTPNHVGSLMHTSYKPDITDLLAGRLDAQIATVVNGCRPGDVIEVWHEADKKSNDGMDTYARYVAAKNYFYGKVKAIRDDVYVANTVTGWLFEPTRTGVDWRRWGAVKADIIGVDCDGIHPTKLPYTNYEGETQRARDFIQEFAPNGYRWYAVPEYGSSRIATDSEGVERARAYTQHGQMWASDPLCLFVALYEYDPSSAYTYRLTTPAEQEAWRNLIGG